MKVFWIAAICVLTASSSPIPEEERVNGENGWYVPNADGSFEWISIDEGENMLEELENQQEIEGRLSTVPVTFYLYTNQNPTKKQKITATATSIGNSDFDASNPTRFVIHGWLQSYSADMNDHIRSAWLARGKYNVIVVDWGRARGEYATAVSAVSATGKKVASMINYLVKDHGMSLDTTEVIGHSLGAHVAGYAGKNVEGGQLHAITGLDTALPLFSYSKPKKRLSSDDAAYVESIHTNGGQLGFLKPIGKGAFYPNGGKSQPGCVWDLTGACDHARSWAYYAEAVARDSFPSNRCGDYQEAVKESCGSTYSGVKMGGVTNAYVVSGEYYVPVRSSAPYGYGAV
ncbi:LOW QUALITY PROTEIN: phospholipase A1-like [Rhagoletis pomonella]|uniref:phospholipase A1-like n=1 Tax=Rhagoletis pomonella TaxID=28610 RepID=UPI001786C7A0|nr:phospholipase A1-like [Rhagoletis pomonella]XP_036341835.1 phospholipase A1-like [Rhagoletis pomonella]XP_036341863.1 LOW QUALITY PROTEIN: phospholipase A1-like [Rhagoletis pomonella]